MSIYQSTPVGVRPDEEEPAARPTSLTVAVGAAIGVAILNLVTAVAVLASTSDLVREQIADTAQGGPVDPDLVDLASERARGLDTLYSSLAYSMIFWAIVLGVLAYFALRAGRTVRVLAALVLFVTAALKAVDAVIAAPGISMITGPVVGLLALLAIVLFFVPASNRYGTRQRAARRSQPR